MIEAYWNEMFGQFKDAEGKFSIPGFPEPLMSAHFKVTNIIGDAPVATKQTFSLCILDPLNSVSKTQVLSETLELAISQKSFWDFQEKHHPEAYPFIKRLLPFLISLERPHFHFFIKQEDEIVASGLMGVTESGCFLFNLSVSQKVRKQGLSKELFKALRGAYPDRKCFYWTKHPWFTQGPMVSDYYIV